MFDEIDQKLIQAIQADIPLTLDPYGDIAKTIGCSKEEVLIRLHSYAENGILKRIGAILHHRDSGFPINGMFACVVPEGQMGEAGERLASLPQVSHCYERKTYPNWPYNLYGMIHGKTKSDVELVVKAFVQDMKIQKYEILYSTEELKKSSMKYF
jgi:DNA-binding Lrp family transcriptional regulator